MKKGNCSIVSAFASRLRCGAVARRFIVTGGGEAESQHEDCQTETDANNTGCESFQGSGGAGLPRCI